MTTSRSDKAIPYTPSIHWQAGWTTGMCEGAAGVLARLQAGESVVAISEDIRDRFGEQFELAADAAGLRMAPC